MFKKYKSWRLHKHINKFGSKNLGYFCYFNRAWFDKWQWLLLWFLNAPILKYWGRFILRIHRDCKFNEVIDQIFPNSYRIQVGKNTYRSDFRTHQKFSKRVYYAFRPIWWTMHAIDWLILDRTKLIPSFNFLELTVYPDADPETSTVDGYAERGVTSEDFSTIRNGAGTVSSDLDTSLYSYLNGSATTNQFNQLRHVYILFDTSSLSNGTISSSVFSGYYSNKINTLGSPDLHLASSTPASNTALIGADFQNVGRTSFGSITYAAFTASQYNNITLNADGLANISKTGISKFSLQLSWDINNSFTGVWVSAESSFLAIISADTAGTSQDPKLVVQYSLPVSVGKPKLGGDGYSTGKVRLGG